MKHLRFIYLLLLLFGLGIHVINAQTDFASEEEFKKQAAKLFDDEEYEKAFPLYSQLVSLYRKDPNYNFRLGVCMLYASDEKERAITFLEFATQNKDVEKEAFFYLGKAYHLNYRFDDAITKYQAYKKMVSGAKAERFLVDRQIEMCNNGKTLLRSITDLPVIQKTEIGREDFFRSYDPAEIGGKLLVKPDEKEFRTALDKKKKENSILYLAANGTQIYFSSYGDNEQSGKDIYMMKKTPTGEWGKPQSVGNKINTKYDEDFPFLHPNGKVLYFCSKGHNSMGGYDIFRTTLNEETNTWNEPENMDFPINTPDDDILYVTNSDEKKAFFASARSSVAGKIAVYHINVERRPIDFVIIKGTVLKNHKDQALNVKITVKKVTDNTILGIYNATSTGSYDIKLTNGGSFLFTVESPDFTTQSDVVTIAVQKEFRPLKQEISFELPSDKLLIKNLFNEAISDSNYLLAINVIKEKAKMEVMPSSEMSTVDIVNDSASANDTAVVASTTTPKAYSKLSNTDIINIANHDAEVVDTEATDAREQADIAMSFANQKNQLAQNKSKEAAALMDAASKADDNVKKQALTDQATAASKEAASLNEETVVAFNLAKKIDATAIAKREEADLSKQYAKGLAEAVNSKNSKEAMAKLDELEKKLDALSLINADRFPVLNSYKKEEENKKLELEKVTQTNTHLKQDISENETIITDLTADVGTAKNDQVKKGLENQIAELKLENDKKRTELEQNEIALVKAEKEYTQIKKESELVSSVVEQSNTSTSETAAANVASIDKSKLEQDVNNIKVTNQTADNSTTSNKTADKTLSDTTSNTNAPKVTNTTAKTLSDINKQYKSDLANAEKIKNINDRETEKADILKKWSKAIDDDVAKQKQDYAATTDPEMKAIQAKKISDAENSSKEKQQQADQSIAKVETNGKTKDKDKGKGKVDATQFFGVGNPTDADADSATTAKTNSKDNSLASNKTSSGIESDKTAENKTSTATVSEKQSNYKEISAKEDIGKADVIDKQADTLETYSAGLKTKAEQEKNPNTKLLLLEQSNDILLQSKEKKIQAAELNSKANNTEYVSNKAALDKSARSNSTSTSDDIVMADMMNDEALIYHDKAQKLHVRADTTKSVDEKAVILKEANTNEMLALEKQKKSSDIYKNHNSTVASTTVNSNNDASTNIEPVHNANSVANATSFIDNIASAAPKTSPAAITDINQKYNADLVAAEKNPNEGDRENEKAGVLKSWAAAIDADVLKQKQDYSSTTDPEMKAIQAKKISDAENSSKEKQVQSKQSLAKAETLKQQNIASNTTSDNTVKDNETNTAQKQKTIPTSNFVVANSTVPVKNNSTSVIKTNEPAAVTSTAVDAEKQNTYKEPAAKEQILKAEVLNKDADEIMGQSVELKAQAVKQKNVETKNNIYAQSEELNKEGQGKKLLAAQLTAEANETQFDSNSNQLDQLASASSANNSAEILKAEITNDESKTLFDNAKKQRIKAASTDSYAVKETELEGARKNEMKALEKQKESMDIYKKYNPNFVASAGNNSVTNNPSNSGTKENIAVTSNNTPPSSEVILTPNEIFEQKSVPVYSVKNPIPINKKLPEGLIFKVQIGAFRKPIPQDLFQGMTPITGETTEKGFIRYTVGVFEKFNTADKVKSKIIDLGYKDAFIVAFLNGKRIPINEAYAMAGGVPANVLKINNPVANTTEITAKNTKESSVAPTNDQTTKELSSIAKAQSVSTVKGLFYTVQVGVFSQPVVAGKLYNMKPLYSETAPNGNLRYYTGVYTSVARAAEATEMINDVGIDDAFVTAYYDGKRISLADAKQYEKQGESVFSTGPAVNKLPIFTSQQKQNLSEKRTIVEIDDNGKAVEKRSIVDITEYEQPGTSNAASKQINKGTNQGESPISTAGIIYKVQIGAFNEEVPLDIANKFLKIASKGIKNYKDNTGLTIYTVGNFKTYEEAVLLKAEVAAQNLTDAFIVAFRDGQIIPVEEARKIK